MHLFTSHVKSLLRMRSFTAWIALLVLLAAAAISLRSRGADRTPSTQESAPDYSSFTQSYHMPFGNRKPVDFDHLEELTVRVCINGGPALRFEVDTGSTGLIVGADHVTNIDPNAPAGSITYSSSGIELDGVWTPVTLTFPDSKDEQGNVATAVVPILAVRESKFHPGAVNGSTTRPASAPAGKNASVKKIPQPYMLGIGTGRGREAHQERNPWVNLNEMKAGTMRRGYQITRTGVTLGLTGATVGNGYLFDKLTPHIGVPTTLPMADTAPKDWDSSNGWISISGKKLPDSGMLIDTGLTNLMIEFPDVKTALDVPDKTEIEIDLLSGKLHYVFKVGDKTNPAVPRRVTWVHRDGSPLINTGLRVLALYDYLYDADGGYAGLRPTRK